MSDTYNDYESTKTARNAHVKKFMDKTGLPKEHAEQYASAVVKYPNNAMAGAEQAADRIAGPKVKVKFHQSGKDYQDKHVNNVKLMHGIMHNTNEEYEVNEEELAEEMYEEISSMLESILSENLVESKDTFASILSSKIAQKLEEAKIIVAQSLFGESKADDIWKSSEDEHEKANRLSKGEKQVKSDEVDDSELSNLPTHQLRLAVSAHEQQLKPWDPSKHRDENEVENPNDKRVIGGAAARSKKGEHVDPTELQTYNHANGDKTHLSYPLAKFLETKLVGGNVSKDSHHVSKDNSDYSYKGGQGGHRERLLNLFHSGHEGKKHAIAEMLHDKQNPKESSHKFEQTNYADVKNEDYELEEASRDKLNKYLSTLSYKTALKRHGDGSVTEPETLSPSRKASRELAYNKLHRSDSTKVPAKD